MRTGLPDGFHLRNPYDQALIAELYSITGNAGPGDDWEPYGMTADGMTHYKRQKPCEECGKAKKMADQMMKDMGLL